VVTGVQTCALPISPITNFTRSDLYGSLLLLLLKICARSVSLSFLLPGLVGLALVFAPRSRWLALVLAPRSRW